MDAVRDWVTEADRLVDELRQLTEEQRQLLMSEELDEAELNRRLPARRAVLDRIQAAFSAAEAALVSREERQRLTGRLGEIKAMDDDNLALAEKHAQALRGQARQMTQTRKGVSGYGRTDLAGTTAVRFDKKS